MQIPRGSETGLFIDAVVSIMKVTPSVLEGKKNYDFIRGKLKDELGFEESELDRAVSMAETLYHGFLNQPDEKFLPPSPLEIKVQAPAPRVLPIEINVSGLDPTGLLEYIGKTAKSDSLIKNKPGFLEYAAQLVLGASLDPDEVLANNVDPKILRRRVHDMLGNYRDFHFNTSQKKFLDDNPDSKGYLTFLPKHVDP